MIAWQVQALLPAPSHKKVFMNDHISNVCALIAGPAGILVGLVMAMYAKQQVFFQRAYVDVNGDYSDAIINIFKYDYEYKHVCINLVPGFIIKDKEGKESMTPSFVRVSRMFFKTYLSGKERNEPNETVCYLRKKLEQAGIHVSNFGYY